MHRFGEGDLRLHLLTADALGDHVAARMALLLAAADAPLLIEVFHIGVIDGAVNGQAAMEDVEAAVTHMGPDGIALLQQAEHRRRTGRDGRTLARAPVDD